MGMNLIEALKMFVDLAQKQQGQNFDPGITAQNMMGKKYNTPKDTLDAFLREGRINRHQYDTYVKLL